jgi:hypothetical protein
VPNFIKNQLHRQIVGTDEIMGPPNIRRAMAMTYPVPSRQKILFAIAALHEQHRL